MMTLCYGRIAMNVSSTRKVSTSLSTSRSVERKYGSGNSQSFVEIIDTSNNVAVRDEGGGYSGGQQNYHSSREDEAEVVAVPAGSGAYVSGSIQALGASGVLDFDDSDVNAGDQNRRVNIYDNNQTISSRQTEEKLENPYFKYFYETNDILEDLDELV